MIRITTATMENANARAFEKRCHVRMLDANNFEVRCANPQHTIPHIVTFQHDAQGQLTGECFMPETGELCPAEIGHRACYHLSAALALYLAITEGRIVKGADLSTHTLSVGDDGRKANRASEPKQDASLRVPVVRITQRDGREFCNGIQI